jgi:hypothetical protein
MSELVAEPVKVVGFLVNYLPAGAIKVETSALNLHDALVAIPY